MSIKKYSLCALVFTSSCSVQPPSIFDDPFLDNLQKSNLVEVSVDFNGGVESYGLEESLPITYRFSGGIFILSRHGIDYIFIRSLGSDRAVFRYINSARGTVPEGQPQVYPAHMGFVLRQGGLYQVGKKNPSPSADTHEAVVAYYGIENINFDDILPAPLYQKSGTEPARIK